MRKRLPGETRFRQMPFREPRPHHCLFPQLGPDPRQCPIGRVEVAPGRLKEELKLLSWWRVRRGP